MYTRRTAQELVTETDTSRKEYCTEQKYLLMYHTTWN